MTDLLFVYGTLLSTADNPMSRLLRREARCISQAYLQGRVFALDGYPGAVLSDSAGDRVHGEVFRMERPDLLLARLDAYEECSPEFPEPCEYRRESVQVVLPDGHSLCAWVYLYNRETTLNIRSDQKT